MKTVAGYRKQRQLLEAVLAGGLFRAAVVEDLPALEKALVEALGATA